MISEDKHFTVAQLDALYAKAPADVREHWEERAGVFEFDGGLSRLEAYNAAHQATIEWITERAGRLDQAERMLGRAVALEEERLRAAGINPDAVYYLEAAS